MKKHYGFKISKEGLESIVVGFGTAKKFAENTGLSIATVTAVLNGGYATENTRKKFMDVLGESDVKKIFQFEVKDVEGK